MQYSAKNGKKAVVAFFRELNVWWFALTDFYMDQKILIVIVIKLLYLFEAASNKIG